MSFAQQGYDIVAPGITADELASLHTEFPPDALNRRNLFVFSPAVELLVQRGSLGGLAREILGPNCFAVRAIFFNKIQKTNWHVPWHQDVGIPVRNRIDVPGFSAFTLKEGILHANAPTEVLSSLLILRIHLDACTASNGAMRIIPGSHLRGRLPEHLMEGGESIQPEMQAGDILRLRPLLLHASAHSSSDASRRVVHIEFAAHDLPGGLEWATRVYPE